MKLTKAEATIDIVLNGERHVRHIRMFDDVTLVTRTCDSEPGIEVHERLDVHELDDVEDVIGTQLGEMLGPCEISLGNAPVDAK